jgi:hypothetical protein
VSTYNSQGELVSTNPARMAPLYQVMALPGTSTQAFTITEAFVPAAQSNSTSGQNFNLSAFMMGNSDPGHYGQLDVYETPSGTTGPANADAEIDANSAVSKDISLLDQKGSEVLLGNTLMVPVGQTVIYLRPMYVAATTNPQPTLQYVVGVVEGHVYIENSLALTLSDIFKTSVSVNGTSPSVIISTGGSVPAAVKNDLTQAQTDYQSAQTALQAGDLGTYQSDIAAMEKEITTAQAAASQASKAGGGTTTTTTTVPKSSKSKTTSSSKDTTTGGTKSKGSTTTTTLASAAARP